jgi:hypothetical protein
MRFRKLRIAWSLGWGLACVLLIVLCVRSYWWQDDIRLRFLSVVVDVVSVRARLVTSFAWVPPSGEWLSFKVSSEPDNIPASHDADLTEMSNRLGFGTSNDPSPVVVFPHWFAAFSAAVLACMPWIHWSSRFRLRTLLIATTLVAVVLGLIVAVI